MLQPIHAFCLATVLTTLGCASQAPPPAEKPGEPASGSPEPAASSTPAPETTEAPAEPQKPAGKRVPCTKGADQTCNADPAASAIWGHCTDLGVCECKSGFKLSPGGYCEPAK